MFDVKLMVNTHVVVVSVGTVVIVLNAKHQ